MISCKIGLISLPKESDINCKKQIIINMGEIFDKNILNDINILYEFHKNLRYLCNFNVIVKNKQIKLDNIEEILFLQSKYKLTKKLTSTKPLPEGVIKYLKPQLYDIDCMIPLFPDIVPKKLYNTNNKTKLIKLFIILPCTNPIIRGELIEKCIESCEEDQGYFFPIGYRNEGFVRPNPFNITKRNLLSNNIPECNIFIKEYDEFPECILEVLNTIDSFCKPDNIYIGVERESIGNVLFFSRVIHQFEITNKKLGFIC
jgi:hypothetical protein